MAEIEDAEIISETKEKESKYFLAIHTAAPLKIASQYDILKADRVEAKNKYCNIDKSESNIENVRKAKNALVKLRTELTGKDRMVANDKRKIKEVFDDITAEFEYKVKSLVDITEPLEKDLNSLVEKFDNKAKEEARKEAEEIEGLKKSLAELKHSTLVLINGMTKSTDDIGWNLTAFGKIQDFADVVNADLQTAYNSRIVFLKEREDLEVEKAKFHAEKFKYVIGVDPAKKDAEITITPYAVKLQELADPVSEILDLEEVDEPAPVKHSEPLDAETTEAIKELEELLQPATFDPSLKEIYDHLYTTYPFLHNNKYFMAFGSKVK